MLCYCPLVPPSSAAYGNNYKFINHSFHYDLCKHFFRHVLLIFGTVCLVPNSVLTHLKAVQHLSKRDCNWYSYWVRVIVNSMTFYTPGVSWQINSRCGFMGDFFLAGSVSSISPLARQLERKLANFQKDSVLGTWPTWSNSRKEGRLNKTESYSSSSSSSSSSSKHVFLLIVSVDWYV